MLAYNPTTDDQRLVTQFGLFRNNSAFGPLALTIGPNGHLYVGERVPTGFSGGCIIEVNPITGQQSLFAVGVFLNTPDGLVFDSSGNLIVSDASGGVIRIDPTGTQQTQVSSGGLFNSIQGITIGGDGAYYVANVLGHNVLRVDPLSGQQTVVTSYNQQVRDVLYVSAITPEPSAWVSCVLGLLTCLGGWFCRRSVNPVGTLA